MNAKTIVAVAVAAALFSGSALAASGNPENPDASTKNWQLDELRHSMNSQFIDVNNRIDQIQAGSGFDASDIYDRLDTHDNQIGDLNVRVNGVDQQVSNIGRDVDELKDQVGNKVDKNDFLKDQQKQNDRMDGMQDQINNNSDRLNGVEVEQQILQGAVSYTQEELEKTNSKVDQLVNTKADKTDLAVVDAKANDAISKAETGIRDADQAKNLATDAGAKADQALSRNVAQDVELGRLEQVKADKADLAVTDSKANNALNAAEQALRENAVQDEQLANLNENKADKAALEDVAIKADGALAGAIENRNQIDAVKEDLANTDKQVNKNKNDIADLKNQNGALNNAVANAQNTANTASDKADKAQNTADKAAASVNNVKNDVKVVSRDVANNSIRIQRNEERIDGAYAGIYDNRKNIEANRRAINRNSHEIQKLNKNFNDLKNTVDANRKRAAAGIAGVAAMANIPEVNSHQTLSVGVGVGGFDGQQAVAVGASARVNDNLTVKASVAANNEEVVWGAGAAIGW